MVMVNPFQASAREFDTHSCPACYARKQRRWKKMMMKSLAQLEELIAELGQLCPVEVPDPNDYF